MTDHKYGLADSSKTKFNSLVKEVLHNVKPTKGEIEEAKFSINEVMGRLTKIAPKNVEILLAGSVARGTQIKGNSDIDIFLLFPRSMKEKEIEKKGLEIAKKMVNKKKNESYIVKYAEHPYTRVFLNDLRIDVDVVPAYKIETAKDRITAVDRTQLHNEFVNSKLTDRQRDDVRVLKAFLKAHYIYGAEARTEGFSGYLCELLVYNYGSFLNVLTGMANAKLPLIIDFSKKKIVDGSSLLKAFGKKFIVVDPTDSDRNVAANVSDESLFRFVLISRQLRMSPDKKSFYGEPKSDIYSESKLADIRKMLGTSLYVLRFDVPDIADDIIWQQLRKTRIRLQDMLISQGFSPIVSVQNAEEKNALMGFFIRDVKIESTKIIGPSLEMGKAIENFIKVHKNPMAISIENDRIFIIEKSRYQDPEKLIRTFLANKSTRLPSCFDAKKSALYINSIPEEHAKPIYNAYLKKFSL
jgi:tRNA nucleotidyltransferase (CCA-adding enzyme)